MTAVVRYWPEDPALGSRHLNGVVTRGRVQRFVPAALGPAILSLVSVTGAVLSSADRALVLRALKYPRGRYSAERASQLSSIPARTLHDWATSGSLVPDWVGARPRGWS